MANLSKKCNSERNWCFNDLIIFKGLVGKVREHDPTFIKRVNVRLRLPLKVERF